MIFMTSCTLVISNYKGLYNANMDVCCTMGHFWQRKALQLDSEACDRSKTRTRVSSMVELINHASNSHTEGFPKSGHIVARNTRPSKVRLAKMFHNSYNWMCTFSMGINQKDKLPHFRSSRLLWYNKRKLLMIYDYPYCMHRIYYFSKRTWSICP